ncbi:phage major capsid protein [Carboxylicivirga sp. M1479]|uniref:phage major capsid protein n=1 Tax=Carboxylicivirga sp. M1479 TaxID=2594476 RepID=UPI001178BE4A|nr:phage major capsid protein [Carboxylicivirga sp. M1479]TRX71511.1 phage major capsid protein [Carboxylicivirga sp. M1479]
MELNNLSLLEVRSLLNEKIEKQKEIVASLKVNEEVRSMTDDERSTLDNLDEEIRSIEIREKELLKIEEIENKTLKNTKNEKRSMNEKNTKLDEFRSLAETAKTQSLSLDELRSITVGATAVDKGIGTETVDFIREYHANNTVIDAGAKVYTGLIGDVVVPRMDANTVKWVTETGEGTESGAFNGISMKPHRISGYCKVSKQFYMQHPQKVASLVMESFAQAVASKVQSTAFTGTGTNQPKGLFNYATSTSGGTDLVNYIELTTPNETELYSGLVKGKYDSFKLDGNSNMTYILSPEAGFDLETKLVNTNSPRFILDNGKISALPAMVDGSISDGSTNVAVVGDFSNVAIGVWDNIDIISDPYTLASSGQIKITVNAFADVTVTRPELFSKITW